MPVISPALARRRARIAISLGVLLVLGAALAWLARPPFEITRIRNAMIAAPAADSDLNWTPDAPPADFLLETGPVPEEFRAAAARIAPAGSDEFTRALAIARHLHTGPGHGPGIRSNTRETYRLMLNEARGYCADYTQVFNGLALAAGIPVREWGISFDGFSGDGHAFNEIYATDRAQWIFIDSYYAFWASDPVSGSPLSVLEFIARLRRGDGPENIELHPIVPGLYSFKTPERALDYYRRGADQLFLWSGNNVFSYDANPLVRFFGPVSRAVEQGAAILAGVHPGIRIQGTAANRGLIESLVHRKYLFLAGVSLWLLLAVTTLVQWRSFQRLRRAAEGRAGDGGVASAPPFA